MKFEETTESLNPHYALMLILRRKKVETKRGAVECFVFSGLGKMCTMLCRFRKENNPALMRTEIMNSQHFLFAVQKHTRSRRGARLTVEGNDSVFE